MIGEKRVGRLRKTKDKDEMQMKEIDFNRIQSRLNEYKYFSMEYLDYSDVSEYEILFEDDNLILLLGYNSDIECKQYHWAANEANDLLEQIKSTETCFISFVPQEWVEDLEKVGFVIYSKWQDYFMASLESIPDHMNAVLLNENECDKASEVTLSCKGQSRGFTGQTKEWVQEWLDNSENSIRETGIQNKTIIIERNESDEIIGLVCTGTYAHDSIKGAIVWIREVAVKPAYQRKGIARRLIMEALSYGKKHGAKRAFLAADECNIYAIHLYESIGFLASEEKGQIDMIRELKN